MQFINKTKSICGVCQKIIPAEIFEREGKIFIKSHCQDHGEVIADHVWDDPEIYAGLSRAKVSSRKAEQVIIDITKKCNLNCAICFARANEYQGNKFELKDLDRLKDYRQVFLSGGEPTVREDLPDIIRHCVKNGQKPILFTNGVKLADITYLKKLKNAGLRSVLLQLDTLNKADCKYIRGRNLVEAKIRALRNLNKLNIPVAIWTVIVKGKNLKDLERLHRFAFKFSNVKTVSAIPIWRIGRYREKDFVLPSEIIKSLGDIYGFKKKEFVATTQLVCNLDRLLGVFKRKRGKLFGVCMVKALLFEHRKEYVTLDKIFNLERLNKKINKIFKKNNQKIAAIAFLIDFIGNDIFFNFLRNKYFRAVFLKFLLNLRFIFAGRFLLLNPFRFITVAIFPSASNIDLAFIKACNSYALGTDDYSLEPACLHYIKQDKKSKK